MRTITGLILCCVGVFFGLYIGIWVCFIGGIIDVIEVIKAPVIIPLDLALGIAKVFFASAVGYAAGLCIFLPGSMMLRN